MWPCIVSQSLLLILALFLLSLPLWQCKDGHCRKFLLYMCLMPNGDGQVARRRVYESAQSSGVRHNTLKKSWEQIYSELYVDRGKASFSVDQGSKRFLIMYHNKALLVQELCSLFLFIRGLHKSWIHTQHHPHTKGGLKSFTGAQKHIKIVLIWEWCVEASSK